MADFTFTLAVRYIYEEAPNDQWLRTDFTDTGTIVGDRILATAETDDDTFTLDEEIADNLGARGFQYLGTATFEAKQFVVTTNIDPDGPGGFMLFAPSDQNAAYEDFPPTFLNSAIIADDCACCFAEGAPSESFIDCMGRVRFGNCADHRATPGAVRLIREMSAPRTTARRHLPAAIRARLDQMAGCDDTPPLAKAG